MNKGKIATLSLLTLIIIGTAFLGTASAETVISGEGVNVSGENAVYEITTEGIYEIMKTIISSSGDNPLILINASDVILDGNGSTIDGVNDSACGIQIAEGQMNVTVKNVTIRNTTAGIIVNSTSENGEDGINFENVTVWNVGNMDNINLTPGISIEGERGYEVKWEGGKDNWNLTISGNDQKYTLLDNIKVNKIDITGENATLDGGGKEISAGENARTGGVIKVSGNESTIRNANIDFSTLNDTNSVIAVMITGENVMVADSDIRTGSSNDSSSQVIVINNTNAWIENNTLTTTSSNESSSSTGSVAVRLYKNAENVTIINNTMNSNSTASRNVGIGADGIQNTVEINASGNSFNLNRSNGYMLYISPGWDNMRVDVEFDKTNQINDAADVIYIDNAHTQNVSTVSISGNLSGNFAAAEKFMEYEGVGKVRFDGLTVFDGYKKEIPGTVDVNGATTLNNLTFTDKTAMIRPEVISNIKITNATFGVVGRESRHGVITNKDTYFSSFTLLDSTFEGTFRKGLLLYPNGGGMILINNNTFNGGGHAWGGEDNKSSVMTIVAEANVASTITNNTVDNYFKILSVDNSKDNGNWVISKNKVSNTTWFLDIDGTKEDWKYDIGYNYFGGGVPEVYDSESENEYNTTTGNVMVVTEPYYTDTALTKLADEEGEKTSREVVDKKMENIIGKMKAPKSEEENDINDLIEEIAGIPNDELANSPVALETLEELENLYIEATEGIDGTIPSITTDKIKNITVIGGALQSENQTTLEVAENDSIEDEKISAIMKGKNMAGQTPIKLDIKLVTGTGGTEVTNLIAPVTIIMDVPDGFDIDNMVIIHFSSTGPELIYPEKADGNRMKIIVTGFSPFAFVSLEAAGNSGSGTGTGTGTVINGTSTVPSQTPTQNQSGAGSTETRDTPPTEKETSDTGLKLILLGGAAIVLIIAIVYRRNKNKTE